MSNEIMQENTPFVECSAFHRGMSVLEASLRNTEDSEAIISGLLKGAAEFYGASRECTNYFKYNFHPLHQATVSLNCSHVISLQKRRSGTYRDAGSETAEICGRVRFGKGRDNYPQSMTFTQNRPS